MDRPEAIYDHADLGTREPGDPDLRGYDPGHPWYYLLGGRQLRPEEIEPDSEWDLPHDTKLKRLTDPPKRKKRLVELREEYERHLRHDIDRYLEVITPGYEVSTSDRHFGYGLETSIYLCHNHILANKMWLVAINRELAKHQLPKSTPIKETSGQEWVLTPIPQIKEQLRLF